MSVFQWLSVTSISLHSRVYTNVLGLWQWYISSLSQSGCIIISKKLLYLLAVHCKTLLFRGLARSILQCNILNHWPWTVKEVVKENGVVGKIKFRKCCICQKLAQFYNCEWEYDILHIYYIGLKFRICVDKSLEELPYLKWSLWNAKPVQNLAQIAGKMASFSFPIFYPSHYLTICLFSGHLIFFTSLQ